jgi:hypothetical protein
MLAQCFNKFEAVFRQGFPNPGCHLAVIYRIFNRICLVGFAKVIADFNIKDCCLWYSVFLVWYAEFGLHFYLFEKDNIHQR